MASIIERLIDNPIPKPFGLGGKKGLEKLVNLDGINADTRILHLHDNPIVFGAVRSDYYLRVVGYVRHSFDAVLDQVDYNLLQLYAVAGHDGDIGGQILPKYHAMIVQFALHKCDGFPDNVINIQESPFEEQRFLQARVFSQ